MNFTKHDIFLRLILANCGSNPQPRMDFVNLRIIEGARGSVSSVVFYSDFSAVSVGLVILDRCTRIARTLPEIRRIKPRTKVPPKKVLFDLTVKKIPVRLAVMNSANECRFGKILAA